MVDKAAADTSSSNMLPGVNWEDNSNKELLFSMLMTSCDISAITKPWPVQQKVATLVANEFFDQGDLERERLNVKPTVSALHHTVDQERLKNNAF